MNARTPIWMMMLAAILSPLLAAACSELDGDDTDLCPGEAYVAGRWIIEGSGSRSGCSIDRFDGDFSVGPSIALDVVQTNSGDLALKQPILNFAFRGSVVNERIDFQTEETAGDRVLVRRFSGQVNNLGSIEGTLSGSGPAGCTVSGSFTVEISPRPQVEEGVCGSVSTSNGSTSTSNGTTSTSNGTTSTSNGTTSTSNGTTSTSNGTTLTDGVTFATLNTAQDPDRVPLAPLRMEMLIEAINASDAEVICLQELWPLENEDGTWDQAPVDGLLEATRATFPHSHIARDAFTPKPPACAREDIDAVLECATGECDRSLGDAAYVACVAERCNSTIANIPASCWECALSNLSSSASAIVNACSPDPTQGPAYAHDGHHGLVLLSRQQFTVVGEVELQSSLEKRAALHARIIDPDLGPVNVYCTQLTRDQPDTSYPENGPYTSFSEEHDAQVTALLGYIDATSANAPVVVMGDLSSGPETATFSGELQDNFQRLLSPGGLSAPYLDQEEPLCTLCAENPFTDTNANQILDHVLLKGFNLAGAKAERVFDGLEPLDGSELELPLPEGLEISVLSLSDRFGVAITVPR